MRFRLCLLLVASLLGACQVAEPALAGVEDAPDPGTAPVHAPYPIVLAHGMLGQESYLGILDYWSTIPAVLEAEGHEVFVTEVDPLNTPMVRGERLVDQIEEIVTVTGHEKVILIGHSQGGLDIRYAASTRPDLVAAVVSMASPHYGTPAVQIALDLLEDDGVVEDVVTELVDFFVPLVWSEVTDETDVYTSLHSMTVEGAAEFAAAFPDSPEVAYFSTTGVTDGIALDHPDCTPDIDAPFMARWANETDPASFPLSLAEALLDDDDLLDLSSNTYPNDGLVRAIDTRWGTFLGCIPADHGEEIGLQAGALPGYHPGCVGACTEKVDSASCECNDFDYELFFLELVDFLRDQGF